MTNLLGMGRQSFSRLATGLARWRWLPGKIRRGWKHESTSAIVILGIVALTFMAAVAQSPAPKPDAKATQAPADAAPPAWTINCSSAGGEAPLKCRMSQDLFVKETGKRILTITIEGASAQGATMLLALPHGLYLPAGVAIRVDDGAARKLDIQTSDAAGVYAGVALDQPLLAAIKRGATLTVSMTGTGRAALDIPVALSGFTAAYARIAALR